MPIARTRTMIVAVKNSKGKPVFRSCDWAATSETQTRCNILNVLSNCPALCDPSCPCEDTGGKFGIRQLKADLLCKHGRKANGKPKKRFCNIQKFASRCPVTCKTTKKKECNKGNKQKKKCNDKIKAIRTTVPGFKVTCTSTVQEWYRSSDYCENAKFRYNCRRTCNACPSHHVITSEVPSEEPSKNPTRSPLEQTWVVIWKFIFLGVEALSLFLRCA